MKYLYIFTIIMFIFIPAINASECTDAEKVDLGKSAVMVKVGHEEQQGIKDPNSYIAPDQGVENSKDYIAYYNYYNLFFYNITEDIIIKIVNDYNNEELLVEYKDTINGTYTLKWDKVFQVTTIKYSVMGAKNKNCAYEVLKNGVYTLPAVNRFYNNAKCDNLKENALCQKYIYSNIDEETFYTKIDKAIQKKQNELEKNEEKNSKSFWEKLNKFIKANEKLIIVGGIIFTTLCGFIIGLILRKRKEKLL